MERRPLVSIVVITYNSSPYVKETLDSVLSQTYSCCELVISDDCSTDDTVELCQKWMDQHRDSRIEMKLIRADKNTGVAGNCNRGFAATKGEWLKFIAGDDMLTPTAVEDYMCYVSDHPDVRHLIAKSVHFEGELQESDLAHPSVVSPYLYRDEVTVRYQYKVIRRTFFGSGPTYFINRAALEEVGGFDERFQMQEDYPLFIKMIGRGHKMHLMDSVTVYYRITQGSVQHERGKDAIFAKNHVRMVQDYKFQYQRETLGPLWRTFLDYSLWIKNHIIAAGNSYNSLLCKLWWFLHKTTDPFLWYARYIKHQNNRYLKV